MRRRSLKEIREKIQIDFLDYPLTILSWVQGAGKTWKALNYAKDVLETHKNSKIIYLSERHNKLNETEDFLKEYKPIHWEGFKRKCLRLDREKDKLSSMKVPLRLICNNLCDIDTKDCLYRRQFDKARRLRHGIIIAPNNYLTIDLSSYKPVWLIVDEKLLTFDEYKRMEDFTKIEEYDSELYKKGKNGAFTNTELNNHASEAVKAKDYGLIESLLKLREHQSFLRYEEGGKDVAYKPHLWDVFDLIKKGIPVTLLDATFDKEIFDILLSRYREKGHPDFDYEPQIYDEKIKLDLKPRVFRLKPSSNYVKTEFDKYNKDLIWLLLTRLHECEKETGVISYMDKVEYFAKPFDFRDLHFWGLSGLNELEDCDTLVIIGDPRLNKEGKKEYYRKIFGEEPEISFGEKKDGRYCRTEGNSKIDLINRIENNEFLNAILRGRQLDRPKNTFLFGGNMKKEIEDLGFEYIEIDDDEEAKEMINSVIVPLPKIAKKIAINDLYESIEKGESKRRLFQKYQKTFQCQYGEFSNFMDFIINRCLSQ